MLVVSGKCLNGVEEEGRRKMRKLEYSFWVLQHGGDWWDSGQHFIKIRVYIDYDLKENPEAGMLTN